MKTRFKVQVGQTYVDTDRRYRGDSRRTVTVLGLHEMPDAHGVIRSYASVKSSNDAFSYIRLDRFAPIHNGFVPVESQDAGA